LQYSGTVALLTMTAFAFGRITYSDAPLNEEFRIKN